MTKQSLEQPFRTGFVALIGKPNVGKSTLLNALIGEKVAIVSHRPQTTRVPLRGIYNCPEAQIIFIDTPGMHSPRHELGKFMVNVARQVLGSADIVCMMVDISKPPTQLDRRIAEDLATAQIPPLLLLNKIDLRPTQGPQQAAYQALGNWDMELALSAQTGAGVPALIDEIVARLPAGEPLYPDDWLVDQSIQNLAAELVREKVLHFTNQEVPHSVAVEVEEWKEHDERTYVRMTINVEKQSQKGIIIGAGGTTLKRIGSSARIDIENLTGRPVYLDLWVKVRPGWRNDPSSLGWLGYHAKDY